MNIPNKRMKSVQLHDFAMNPNQDTPRSQFNLSHGRKVPFNFSELIPILCEFVIPGDTWNCNIGVSARTETPIVPIQDNWRLNYFSFFVPMRIIWANSRKFFGEQDNPGDSIAYTIPTQPYDDTIGSNPGTLWDYFGLPMGITAANQIDINTLPFRAYTRIYNEWFRDENLQGLQYSPTDDGPDVPDGYGLLERNKRFDYFTQALPWPQKGNTAVTIPITGNAPVVSTGTGVPTFFETGDIPHAMQFTNGNQDNTWEGATPTSTTSARWGTTNLVAALGLTNSTTINELRTSVTLQQYLEKEARGGTRYNEFVWNMYRVRTQDSRLSRPEFIGGGHAPILTIPIAQTSATDAEGSTTPLGNLAATGYVGEGRAGFTYSATEHGYIITLVCATADLTYSQGLRKMWTMSTRYDVPVPLLANLGEQPMLTRELFCNGDTGDDDVFGYVPRFDEFRFIPSQICGVYRPDVANNIAYWHSSEEFESVPVLNGEFIIDKAREVLKRNFSAGEASSGQQIKADFYFNIRCARTLPLYGIPGLTRF